MLRTLLMKYTDKRRRLGYEQQKKRVQEALANEKTDVGRAELLSATMKKVCLKQRMYSQKQKLNVLKSLNG